MGVDDIFNLLIYRKRNVFNSNEKKSTQFIIVNLYKELRSYIYQTFVLINLSIYLKLIKLNIGQVRIEQYVKGFC